MATTKPESNPGGLFAKVVKFVRNPGTSWGADAPEEAHESGYSRQMLKEMIERKRRNDFVRKREFDMLRKLRRSEAIAGNDPAARPSFFLSSMPSRPDDRASTLKKIDEIEAQMSQQWWKSKGVEATRTEAPSSMIADMTPPPVRSSQPPDSQPRIPAAVRSAPGMLSTPPSAAPAADDLGLSLSLDLDLPLSGGGSGPGGLPPASAPAPLTASKSSGSIGDKVTNAFASTMRPEEPTPSELRALDSGGTGEPPLARDPLGGMPAAGPWPQVPQPSWMAQSQPQPLPPITGSTSADSTQPAALAASGAAGNASDSSGVEASEYESDPELEDAAIRFASGDDAGAEAALRGLIAPGATRHDHAETWLALFDLYRALSVQDRFDELAAGFADRFGRSAPQWRAPRSAMRAASFTISQVSPLPAPSAPRGIDWASPSSLGMQSVATLQAATARTPMPWRISWARLSTIDDAAAPLLSRLFAQWASQPLQIHFVGSENLERVLQARTPSADSSVDPAWWRLRMDALRLMNRAEDFEMVALDYCVTYEVSPPSWEMPRTEFRALAGDGSGGVSDDPQSEFEPSEPNSGFEPSMLSSRLPKSFVAELEGTLEGDIDALLRTLAPAAGTERLTVSCAQLTRIDFSAAGSLLNWAAARTDECDIHFSDVHRLIGAFFAVVGINGLARVTLRRD